MNEIGHLQRRLDAASSVSTRDWWEKYLKGVIPFRGTKMAEIRRAVHRWYKDEHIDTRSGPVQQELARTLLRQEFAEDKLAGVLLLQEMLLPAGIIHWQTDLDTYATLFDEGYIFDWNTCDWFCVKFLGPLALAEGEACARAIASWKKATNLWRRRAAGVAFVNIAPRGDDFFPGFVEMLIEVCAATVRFPERFAQTGTGWVLRELSLAAPDAVATFVQSHLTLFSREALRSAVKNLDATQRQRLLDADTV
jgi:3-methyladenine DNA glycosylase AlkD